MEKTIKGRSMWVVKIGGSLLGTPELARWLEIFAKFSDGQVVIVPGGSLFADAVREAQNLTNASDAVAHKLAVIAMDQFGLLLAGLNPALATASSELEIAERGWQHRGIVWLPSKMVLADDTIPQNWQVTSDSLSAWLANKLGAQQLILIKARSLDKYSKTLPVPVEELIEHDLVDSQFIDFTAGQNYQTWLLDKADYTLFEHDLSLQKLKENGLAVKIASH
ncbi:MAG TPA: uridylate kinase [Methylotenera sp.]|nr:uridylate kinase [Methylotenera sp.]